MVKRPKKFVIVDDSSPAVVQAKSREQPVPSSFQVKMRILKGEFFATKEGGSMFSGPGCSKSD